MLRQLPGATGRLTGSQAQSGGVQAKLSVRCLSLLEHHGSLRDADPVPRATEAMSQDEAASLQGLAAGLRGNGPAQRCTAAIIWGADSMHRRGSFEI